MPQAHLLQVLFPLLPTPQGRKVWAPSLHLPVLTLPSWLQCHTLSFPVCKELLWDASGPGLSGESTGLSPLPERGLPTHHCLPARCGRQRVGSTAGPGPGPGPTGAHWVTGPSGILSGPFHTSSTEFRRRELRNP